MELKSTGVCVECFLVSSPLRITGQKKVSLAHVNTCKQTRVEPKEPSDQSLHGRCTLAE